MSDIGDELDLYDTEFEASLQILGQIQAKYADRKASPENFQSMANEVMDRFNKIGLIATVNFWDEAGRPKLPPEIIIEGRNDENHEYDPERQEFEAKKTEEIVEKAVKKLLKQGGTVDTKASVDSVEVTPKLGS